MEKVIKLTEADLHKIIMDKIQEALEHNVDLGYKPAIGNKKRKPGDEIEDQMRKRRNTKLDESLEEIQGPHDQSQVYDDIYGEIEPILSKIGASPVYGFRGDKGVSFSVKDGRWVVIKPMGFNGYYNDDSLMVTISKYPTDDPYEADKAYTYVNLYDLNDALIKLCGSSVNESKKNSRLNEKSIYRRLPDGDLDYDGEEDDGSSVDEKVTIELDENDYAVAFKNVLGREPVEDDFETLPIDITVRIKGGYNRTSGDYWTPGSEDFEISDWEIADKSYDSLTDDAKKIVYAAADAHIETCDPYDLISESKRKKKVLKENKLWDAMTADMKKFADAGKDVYDFLEYATEKYGIDEEQFYTSGGYEVWCDFTGEDPMTYEY